MKQINVGVIGCGYWGPNLARNFAKKPGSRLLAVADMSLPRAQRVGEEFSVPVVSQQASAVIDHPDIDLVVVATPVWTHYQLARQAILAGKHVLVMKPLTTRADQAEELCQLAAQHGVLLAVDHTFLFTGAVEKIKELVDTGELGELFYFDSVRINLGLFQSDVNVLWDLAPHDLSILDALTEAVPDEVSAVGMCHGGSPTENIAYLTMRFGKSFLAHVHVNWLAPAKIRRTIVGGSRKMLVYDDMEPSEKIRVYDKGVSFSEAAAGEGEDYKLMVSYRSGDMTAPQLSTREALSVEADNILAAIRGEEKLRVDGWAGVRVVRTLEAAERSIALSGAPVPIRSQPHLLTLTG